MPKKTKSKKKGNVQVITLQCTVDKKHRVQTIKNVKNSPDKLTLRKYNSNLRQYTLHEEIKTKSGNKNNKNK
ncbi:MAG TPA: 50S ribosomal protein L33 [Candidatus Saccharimonadales bacterium]|nr:50S ribosomal protein L33 [Candidatus Saccharimonadales bacterium]